MAVVRNMGTCEVKAAFLGSRVGWWSATRNLCIFHHFHSFSIIFPSHPEVKAIPKPRNVLQDERPYRELS